MKKLQKIVCLWMAILLTALSVNATAIITFDIQDATASTSNHVDALTFGKTVTYFIESSPQELLGENERDSLPFSLDDTLFFLTQSRYNTGQSIGDLKHFEKIAPENTSFSKFYTKQILFPFHSYW